MPQLIDINQALHSIDRNGGQTRLVVRELFEIMDEMLANRDYYTFLHAIRVAELSRRIGQLLQLPEAELEILELGCLVHDIGKIAIPDDVLLKPGRFDWEDRKIMELHPLIGANLFSKRLINDKLIEIILNHHERLDGSGYPNALRNGEISATVRIVAVADVYEALVAMRPYKKPLPHEVAMRILRDEVTASRLDGDIVEILARVTEEWSPLSLTCDIGASYQEQLEDFRRKTYFKEPLSDFYNYRYLLAMDQKQALGSNDGYYNICMIDFKRLREFNRRYGYVKADELLNEIGGRLHATTKALNDFLDAEAVMLVRKGADYLIHTCCPQDLLQGLFRQIRQHLDDALKQWGLEARFISRQYPAGFPIEKALNELFNNSEA